MAEEHKDNSGKSVEQNLNSDYVPKGKAGGLPMPNSIDDALKKKMDKTNKEIEKFKNELVKKFKYVEAVGVVPAQANKKVEEEYEITAAEAAKGLIHVAVVIPEKHFKEIGKVRLEAIALAKKVNDKIWAHVITPVDIWNLGLDSKFEVMEAISMAYPILDKGLLADLRVAQIHKSLVLRKFEKYVTSYVIGGSVVRGEAKPDSDVDVFIVIDDTDVKRMPRLELKEKLRGIIFSYIPEAEAMAGVKNKLNVQPYLMTDFWEAVKDAHPVMFGFIRDGIPMYDRGAFLPWKSLLRMGKIKPSPEAIDMFMSSGNKLKETVNKRIFDVATLDLFWGINTPTQGLLMLYGLAPPNVFETVKQFREVFVKKEKLIEKKYADILEEIVIKVWKAYEHGDLKPGDISGTELDRLSKNAIDYIERLKDLREQIEKRVREKSIEQIYKDVFGMLEALLKKKSESAVIKAFDEEMVKAGRFPHRFLEGLKFISNTKKDVVKAKKAVIAGKKKADKLADMRQRNAVEQARKISVEIVDALVEHTQRCDMVSIDRSRYIIKGRDLDAYVLFLNKVFVVRGKKIEKLSGSKLVASSNQEIEKALALSKNKNVKIDFKALDTLRKIFGEFELMQ